MWGCWVVMATFGNFWLIKSFPAPGNWIVASVIAGIFFASLPPWFRLLRRFLYSTAWAKAQGYTAGQVKLFSFSRRNLWRVLIFAGAGVVLAYGQFKLVTHLSGVSQLSEDLKGSAARTKEQITRLATQRQSVAPKLAFGPSVFGTIYESQEPDALTFFGSGYSTNANVLACFDSGELFVGSREMWEVHKQGALGTRPEQYNRVQVLNGVVGLETAIRPAENQNWDELTADAVAEQLDPVQTMSVDRFPATMNKLLPSIWMFRTHNGSMGIFQILGLTENPRGVKLRYKLVQNGNTAPVVAAPKLTFGPVDEQLLTRMRAIDFDTDKLATLGLDKNGNFRHDIYYWPVVDMRKQGLDALYEAQTSNSLLTGDLKVIDLLNNDWERIRPEQLKQLFQSLDLAPGRPPPAIEFKTNGLTTYGFQTREGGMGILQITCSTDNPRGVKLRYKLVQTDPAATNAAPAQTAAFQIRRVDDDSYNSPRAEEHTSELQSNHVKSVRLLPGVLLDGKAVENAGWNTSESRTNLVLGLTEDGSRQFATVTAANLQHRITMLFQGRALFAPVIQAGIASRCLESP